MPLTVVEYIRKDGSRPYGTWFDGLSPQGAAKTAIARRRIGEDLVILLGGGTKRRQQPDIERAKTLCAEYRVRKLAATTSREN